MKRFTDILNEHNSQARGVTHNSLAYGVQKVKLFEHRGAPDPQKAKAREESRKRGEERRKNAELRRKEEQKQALQRQRQRAERQRNADIQKSKYKTSADLERQKELSKIPVAQRLQQIKEQKQNQQKQQQKQNQQKQQQVQNQQKQQVQNQKNKEKLQSAVNEQEAVFEQEVTDILATAPTDNTKQSAETLTKDVKEINNQVKSDLESELKDKSDAEKQELRTKKKQEIEDKYNQALEKAEKDLKTSEEKSWMNSSAKKVFDRAKKVFEAWWELFGYKDITNPVKEIGQKYLGLKFERSDKDKSQKVKQRSMKVVEELGKNKQQRLKELQAQGYSRQEAEDILTDVMQRRTTGKTKQQDIQQQQQQQQDIQQQQPKKKKAINPNDHDSLRRMATNSAAKKIVNERITNKNKYIKEYMAKGLDTNAAKLKWYKETQMLLS